MYLIRKSIRLISLLVIGCLINSCTAYKLVELKKDQPIQVKNKIVILYKYGTQSTALINIELANNQLIGDEISVPYDPEKNQQVHIYVDSFKVDYTTTRNKIIVPLTSIIRVEVYDVDIGLTVFYNVAGTAAAIGIVFLAILLTKESCPFIYAFDGESYKLCGEIYSGAIHPPLERHDYLPLPALKPANNEYLIKMTNEVHEIQYTNLTELLVIDHPMNSDVLVDKYGVPHTLTALQSPKAALNLKDESILDQITRIDSLNYMGDAVKEENNLLDGIILSFDRPQNADTAKLVVWAKNSFWLDYIYGQFYNLFGNVYHDWFEEQKTAPASRMQKWAMDQGIPLAVYLEKNGEWEFVDYFNVIGPLAPKKDVLAIDVSDIQANEVKIKLEFGFLFWEIDFLAMDFSADLPVQKNKVTLKSALDQDGLDVANLLFHDDSSYQVLAEIGEHVSLKFPVPELAGDINRTTILHTKGHYQVLRNPQGIPNLPLLYSFRKPGRFIEFSKKRYLEISAAIGQ